MKYLVLIMALFSGFAHAGSQGSFRGGGIAFQNDVATHHKIKVIKIGDKYAEGVHYVNVVDTVTNEQYVLLLADDQIYQSDDQLYVETDVRSNSL